MTTTMSRSDMKMLERGIRQKWDIPDQALSMVPMKMLGIMAKGTDRDAIAAGRVIAALMEMNNDIDNPVALVAHQHTHQFSPVTADNIEQQRAALLGELHRIRHLSGGAAGSV